MVTSIYDMDPDSETAPDAAEDEKRGEIAESDAHHPNRWDWMTVPSAETGRKGGAAVGVGADDADVEDVSWRTWERSVVVPPERAA